MPKSNQEKLLAALNALYEITPILDDKLDSKESEHHRAKIIDLCTHIANLYE